MLKMRRRARLAAMITLAFTIGVLLAALACTPPRFVEEHANSVLTVENQYHETAYVWVAFHDVKMRPVGVVGPHSTAVFQLKEADTADRTLQLMVVTQSMSVLTDQIFISPGEPVRLSLGSNRWQVFLYPRQS